MYRRRRNRQLGRPAGRLISDAQTRGFSCAAGNQLTEGAECANLFLYLLP
jgi:hypothetical protein